MPEKLVEIDAQLAKRMLEARFPGGVSELLLAWGGLHGDACWQGKVEEPDRATVYRWLGGQFPKNEQSLLRFCGILDVDPFALVRLRNGLEREGIQRIYGAFLLGIWKPPALSFIRHFLGVHVDWPPAHVARSFYRRSWQVCHFDFEAVGRPSGYFTFNLTFPPGFGQAHTLVVHFAYRVPGLNANRWIQYGILNVQSDRCDLTNISGDFLTVPRGPVNEPVAVSTFVGPSAVQFRIASLHVFSAALETRCEYTPRALAFRA